MEKKTKIAIIDNGINEFFLQHKLENKVTVSEKGIVEQDTRDMDQQQFRHGTNCAMILERYLDNCSLTSIRILDDSGKGPVCSIKPALEWCWKNKIYIINLSFGTTHFADKKFIRFIVNEYANRGMVIIAASANSGYISYPASFSNVIGIVAGETLRARETLKEQRGVDFDVSCEFFPIVKSNSYAAPYFAALVGKMILESDFRSIAALKSKLSKVYGDKKIRYNNCGSPDWISSAWFDGDFEFSVLKPYFHVYTGTYDKYKEFVDTIIFTDKDKYGQYKNTGKNLVYLGKENLIDTDFDGFYWSSRNRVEQIKGSERRADDLQIPIILYIITSQLDLICLATDMKDRFAKDNYNIYSVSLEMESVFYDLEYIPEYFFCEEKEDLHNFLYWQTYYQQSDGIMVAISDSVSYRWKNIMKNVDMIVWIDSGKKGNRVRLRYGKAEREFDMNQASYDTLYKEILSFLI